MLASRQDLVVGRLAYVYGTRYSLANPLSTSVLQEQETPLVYLGTEREWKVWQDVAAVRDLLPDHVTPASYHQQVNAWPEANRHIPEPTLSPQLQCS